MSLPKGYKRLEYIQSSGTQYIDTGFKPNQNSGVTIDFQMTAVSGWQCLFGADNTGGNVDIYSIWHTGSAFGFYYAKSNKTWSGLNGTARHTIVASKNTAVADGSSSVSITASTFTTNYPLTLFMMNYRGTIGNGASMKLFSCQIYDNGTLVRDFIPCQNAGGAVGLWDDANEVFYGNAGTGTFTAGPVVPEIVDENEITELEYIQSNGTQYVNTVFSPSESSRISFDFQSTGSSGDSIKAMFGARLNNDTKCFDMFALPATAYPQYGANAYNAKPISVNILQRTVYDMNRNTATVNGTSVSFAAETFDTGFPVYLFTLNDNGTADARPISGKLYACQIYDNGLLERDYIPAMLTNGEVGLYDRVFHEFYRNAGTGEFIAGSETVREGYTELECIESSGTQYLDTGFIPNQNTRLVLNGYNDSASSGWIYGTWESATSKQFAGSCNKSYAVRYGSTNATLAENVPVGPVHFDQNKNAYNVNGATGSFAAQTFSCQYSIFLFAINAAGVVSSGKFTGKIYSCQIYDNGAEVRIYIPVLHPSGVVGLWDSANERFYTSAATTDFIAGPEAQAAPKAPANFRVVSEFGAMVTLEWDASDKAVGYRLYRSGQLLADTEETSVSVTVEPFAGAAFLLKAYNKNGEGAGAELTYFNAPDDPIFFLVTDRTQQDVTERNRNGYYAASDLSRVGFAVDYLQKRLLSAGVSVSVSPVLTWTDEEWATPAAMTAYLKDVQTMRNALKVAETTPTAPEDMAKLTYSEANDIEAILVALDAHITQMLSILDAGWASGLAHTGFYFKEAY